MTRAFLEWELFFEEEYKFKVSRMPIVWAFSCEI